MSIFSASKNSFEGMHSNEETILLLHAHWFVIFAYFFVITLLAVAPVACFLIFYNFISLNDIALIFWFITALYWLILWYLLFYRLMLYTLTVWIVTNERIIDSNQNGFFSRTISEMSLSRVQDVEIKTKGFISTMLHFGDIEVQTAGTEKHFFFRNIPNPEQVKERIVALAEECRNKNK